MNWIYAIYEWKKPDGNIVFWIRERCGMRWFRNYWWILRYVVVQFSKEEYLHIVKWLEEHHEDASKELEEFLNLHEDKLRYFL